MCVCVGGVCMSYVCVCAHMLSECVGYSLSYEPYCLGFHALELSAWLGLYGAGFRVEGVVFGDFGLRIRGRIVGMSRGYRSKIGEFNGDMPVEQHLPCRRISWFEVDGLGFRDQA